MEKAGKYLHQRLLDFDFLGAPVGFHMGGKKVHDTICGSIVSIGIMTTVFLYAVQLMLLKRDFIRDPVVLTSHRHGHFTPDDEISNINDGFDFAIAITSYHGVGQTVEETFKNVKIEAYIREVDFREEEDYEIKRLPLELDACNDFKLHTDPKHPYISSFME